MSASRFRDVFLPFLKEWWSGPSRIDGMREFFYSIGDPRDSGVEKERGLYTLRGVELELDRLFRNFRTTNMLYGIGYTYNVDYKPILEEMLYDRIVYDFDSKENPDEALRRALEFARSLKSRFGCDALVLFTGFKGAHVVIPLAKPVKWDGYQLIWKTLIAPYNFKGIIDRNILQWNRLDRIPFTYNVKRDKGTGELKRRFARIVYPEKIKVEDFHWSLFEPLEPSSIEITRVDLPTIQVKRIRKRKRSQRYSIKLSDEIEELAQHDAVPPCIRNFIDAMVKTGNLDHNQRMVMVLYLKWVGYGKEKVIEFFAKYAKDYKEKITRYQVEYLYGLRGSRKNYKMYSCKKMKELGLCLDCGWNKNPVSYTNRYYNEAKE